MLMNSLYGRFGMNPLSRITEIVDNEEKNSLMEQAGYVFSEMIADNCFIVVSLKNTFDVNRFYPTISAVQLAAAITAYARIYMHPVISREDCIYTDTDSAVTQTPLPPELLSGTELGKFKLVDTKLESSWLLKLTATVRLKEVVKFKGPLKGLVDHKGLKDLYKNPYMKEKVKVTRSFNIDWQILNIKIVEQIHSLGIMRGSKRLPVEDQDGIWIDTEPMNIDPPAKG